MQQRRRFRVSHSRGKNIEKTAYETYGKIKKTDSRDNAFQTLRNEAALEEARQIDVLLANGAELPLAGMSCGLQDNIWVEGEVVNNGQPRHDRFEAPADATVTKRIKDGGGRVIGKTSMTEGAFSQHRPDQPAPLNPWNPQSWTGTSSSGSGVAVATGKVDVAIGTDAGGSVIYPATVNGITGIKPTWGAISRYGVFPHSPTVDHVGILARTAELISRTLLAVAGRDANDNTTCLEPLFSADLGRQYTLAIPRGYALDGIAPEVATAFNTASAIISVLFEVEPNDVPLDWETATEVWDVIAAAELAASHRDLYAKSSAVYGSALSAFIGAGNNVTIDDYINASIDRSAVSEEINAQLQGVDFLLVPALSRVNRTVAQMSGLGGNSFDKADLMRFTAPFNLSGYPSVAFPIGIGESGVPVAAQLIGRPLTDLQLLAAVHKFQLNTNWSERYPPGITR